ncbi:MAG: response regulator transcription factor, partial [Planctomicrobium sp.]|nr:response regulator transcription factor [Planctomicrobium sp.]
MTESKKDVVLVDNHPVVIEALQNRLNQTQEFNVVASVNHSDKAFFEVMERVPDVVIMEIELPGRGATAVAEQIIQRLPTTKIVFFTSYDSDVYIDFALKIGVAGYVLKSESLDMFVSGLKTVCQGEK